MPAAASAEENLISVIAPAGVMEAIFPVAPSVNQMLPSGPEVMPTGLLGVGVANEVTIPWGVIRTTSLLFESVDQKLPSASIMIDLG
jgi:hypothetical protein